MLTQLKCESDDVADVELTNTLDFCASIWVQELQQEIRRYQHQMHLTEERLRLFTPDPAVLTTMNDVEVCQKFLEDALGRVQERKRFLLCSHVGSFDVTASTSAMQQHLYLPPQQQHGDIAGGGFGSDEVASWVSEGMPPATSSSVASMFAGPPESIMSFSEQRGTYEAMHRDAAAEVVGPGMQMCHVDQPGQSDDSWQQAYTSAELLSALIPSTPFPLDDEDEMDTVMLSPPPMVPGVHDHHRPAPVDDAAAGCSQVPTDNGGVCSHGLPRVNIGVGAEMELPTPTNLSLSVASRRAEAPSRRLHHRCLVNPSPSGWYGGGAFTDLDDDDGYCIGRFCFSMLLDTPPCLTTDLCRIRR
ncbi:hypothetical protein ABZP36_010943 [Zizania latifolia]